MSLGTSFPSGYIQAQIKRQLRPGKVIKLLRVMDDAELHEKRFVVLHVDEQTITCVINSKVNPFIATRPALMQCQVAMSATEHTFMHHDSSIDCSRLHTWSTQDVLSDLVKQPEWVLGDITTRLRDDIVAALKFARTLSAAEVELICDSLASMD